MKILITGGAGYIGSHTILETLENTDWEVISMDNFSNSDDSTFSRIRNITGKEIKNYEVDLKDLKSTEKVFEENPDIAGIIHFAAFKAVGESVKKPLEFYDNNLNSLKNILLCQEKYGVKNLIFSSSCSVYGNSDELPITEETGFGTPESPYGYTKQIGEMMIRDFIKANPSCSAICLRYFNPVGAHESGLNGELPSKIQDNFVPIITQTAIGDREEFTVFGGDYNTKDGTCVRDYIHVSDIANAHILGLKQLIKSQKNNSEVINIGTGVGTSVLEIIHAFEDATGEKLNYKIGERRAGDVSEMYANNSKAKSILDWEPKRNLEKMMASAWKWQKHLKEK
ncbi:MAG: UDP-glucose 4-epimerase GalE [Flavobacteriales bacterium]